MLGAACEGSEHRLSMGSHPPPHSHFPAPAPPEALGQGGVCGPTCGAGRGRAWGLPWGTHRIQHFSLCIGNV